MTNLPKISIHTSRFQKGLIIFSVFYMFTIIFLQYKQNYFSEKNIPLLKISEAEKRLSSQVDVGLQINNFTKFDFYKNKFIMDAVVWFSFPIGGESIRTIERFSFRNGEIISKSEPIVRMIDRTVLVRYHITAKLTTALDYRHFPASDHKLAIILQNQTVSPQELSFNSEESSLNLSHDLKSRNWAAKKTYVDTGYLETSPGKGGIAFKAYFPTAIFTIDFYNKDLRHFVILYLPLFLLFLLIFSSLLLRIDLVSSRLPIVVGVTPILALHSLVIENISPPGSHITKVDKIYFSLIGLALIMLMFQAYIGFVNGSFPQKSEDFIEQKNKQLKRANDFVIVFVLAALIIALTYTTFI